MLFDTLQLSKDLQESFSPQQAETLARVLAQAGDDQLVTKADFAGLKADFSTLKADFTTLKADFTAFKSDLSAEIAALEGRLIKESS